METYYFSCKKYAENKNPSARKTKKNNAFIRLCCLWQEKIHFY